MFSVVSQSSQDLSQKLSYSVNPNVLDLQTVEVSDMVTSLQEQWYKSGRQSIIFGYAVHLGMTKFKIKACITKWPAFWLQNN